MGAVQILKIVFLVLIILLSIAFFVINYMLGNKKNIDFNDRKTRALLRARTIIFIVMLVLLLLIVVIT